MALFDIFKHPTEKQISGRAGEDAALDHLLAAQFYLLRYRPPPPCRFDVIAIEGGRLQWLKNAIQA